MMLAEVIEMFRRIYMPPPKVVEEAFPGTTSRRERPL